MKEAPFQILDRTQAFRDIAERQAQEFVTRLRGGYGLTPEQVRGVLETIKSTMAPVDPLESQNKWEPLQSAMINGDTAKAMVDISDFTRVFVNKGLEQL